MRDFKVAMITNDNHPIPDWVAERFGSAGIEYVYHECHTREELEKYAADAVDFGFSDEADAAARPPSDAKRPYEGK